MTCDECRNVMDDYVSGRIRDPARHAIEDHLGRCSECREDLEAARLVVAELDRLPRSIAPERELWTGIAHRIRPGVRYQPWLVAAAVLLVLAPAALLLRPRPDTMPEPGRPAPSVAPLLLSYQSAALELERSVKERTLASPGVGESVARHLATLDAAIAESAGALRADPGNETVQALLLSAHRKKLALLRQAAELMVEG